MSFLQQFIKLVAGKPTQPGKSGSFKELSTRDLIRRESKIGAELFGPIPSGHIREFFCLDEHTWVWHEEWKDKNRQQISITTRYEINPKGVIKVQQGHPYKNVEGQELANLMLAIELYYEQVVRGVYGHDPATGRRLGGS